MTFIKGYTPWNKGKYYTEEEKRRYKIKGFVKGMVAWNKGLTKKTDSRMMKLSLSLANRHIPKKVREKISLAMKGKKKPKEIGQKISKAKMGHLTSDKAKEKMSQSHKKNPTRYWLGKHRSEETIKKLSKSVKKLWENPDYVKNWIQKNLIKPTIPEQKLNDLLQKTFPNEYKLNVLGDVIIVGKIPDFININGQKKIIEMYGDYWHRNDNPQDRIDLFAKYGYQTLIIWEKELKNIDNLKVKLKEFCNA